MEQNIIHRDAVIAMLTEWQQRLGRYSECGNCERDFLGQIIEAIKVMPAAKKEE